MAFSPCYTSCACNQTPTSANWGKNNLICFASCNSIRIYDPTRNKIVKTLCKHSQRVNSVRWISGNEFEDEIVSGSSDGLAIVWTKTLDSFDYSILEGHAGTVNLVDGLYKKAERRHAVVLTASVDSTIKIWTREGLQSDFCLSQTINLGYGISMAIKCFLIPKTDLFLLANGTESSTIDLYVNRSDSNDLTFVKCQTLKGHENWVRGLDFTVDDEGDVLLASASQDAFIRLWRISEDRHRNMKTAEEKQMDRILQKAGFEAANRHYVISFESLLTGHEAWIYSVHWSPKEFALLSASLDKSMIMWEWSTETGLWLEKIRVGEVGGNTLGFYGGMFGPDGRSILAHGYHGAFHIWNLTENTWEPSVTVGGHFGEVVDLCWEPQGEFLISVSCDQTTRIHAPWSSESEKDVTWHEIARPQVHGYDMSCLAMLGRYRFASGAEEKVVRVFKAPINFVENFRRICNIKNDPEGDSLINDDEEMGPKGASVPSLGLSNKAVFDDDNKHLAIPKSSKEPYAEESHFSAVNLTVPPTEETLLQNTLWPETQKLYGHGYELYSLAATSDGLLLASACKANNLEHASIILWRGPEWKIMQKLSAHNLTVVQLAFSPNGDRLLSVSRDRRWTLFEKDAETQSFQMVAMTDKRTGIHTRIIWCCGWSHDSRFFATGSRDGKVVVWSKNENKPPENVTGQYQAHSTILELKGESITAVTFAPLLINHDYLIAVGLESGSVFLYKWNANGWSQFLHIDKSDAHHLDVKRLAFRPVIGRAGSKQENILQLASCGSDNAVKIYDILLNT